MAAQWGNNVIGAGQAQNWFFVRPAAFGALPVFSVMPLSPSFEERDGGHLEIGLDQVSFPTWNELGTSTLWVKRSNDGSELVYFLTVMNFSHQTLAYAFLEADL